MAWMQIATKVERAICFCIDWETHFVTQVWRGKWTFEDANRAGAGLVDRLALLKIGAADTYIVYTDSQITESDIHFLNTCIKVLQKYKRRRKDSWDKLLYQENLKMSQPYQEFKQQKADSCEFSEWSYKSHSFSLHPVAVFSIIVAPVDGSPLPYCVSGKQRLTFSYVLSS